MLSNDSGILGFFQVIKVSNLSKNKIKHKQKKLLNKNLN